MPSLTTHAYLGEKLVLHIICYSCIGCRLVPRLSLAIVHIVTNKIASYSIVIFLQA